MRAVSLLLFAGGLLVGIVFSLLFFLASDSRTSACRSRERFQEPRLSPPLFPDPEPAEPKKFDLENLETKKYLFSEFAPKHTGKPIHLEHPAHLRQEYRLRKTLFVGVLSSQMYLHTRAKAMFETWGQDVSMLAFFVGEDCIVPSELSHLPVIKLPGVPDAVYPPLKKAFAVMQYMYEHYVDDYEWFIRADDDFYLRGNKLMELLNMMDAGELISLGRAGEGRTEDMDRLKLLEHEKYCMGGPGMMFSRGMMVALGPYLDLCLKAGELLGLHCQQLYGCFGTDSTSSGSIMYIPLIIGAPCIMIALSVSYHPLSAWEESHGFYYSMALFVEMHYQYSVDSLSCMQ